MAGMDRLPIEDAAHRLRLSVSTLRRRIRTGSLAVERQETPQGYRYVVLVQEPEGRAMESDSDGAVSAMASPLQDQLAELLAERDWPRRRAEELTTLLNREQEAVLRLAAPHDRAPLPAPAAPVEPPAVTARQDRRKFPASCRRRKQQ